MEKTLVLIKPDGVKRKLIGEIISFYERKNLNIIALKMIKANREIAEKHYEEHKEKPYFNELINYITEERLCAIVIEGNNAIEIVRKINGNKDPLNVDMGSIRGRFSCDKTRNLVHASDNLKNADREIKIWFPELK
ncbi:nucleoside diphosphate kinase [Clostridium sp. USBA 49]|uniref:nucleoside-diphosphate kinase n=1 Tax=Clostridium sp. USBA 49 TaxID=1881060 RepID=UPI00099AA892|nr:nucleoside-diphosphate kinase [Clostridium sp. USBA 49]SKA72893.1 nucleoside diphosphate kinase [Clostridium sp. USBA 49]